jgi:hypothetical protein
MLELGPNCECCDVDPAPNGQDAYICSFECTFCADCKLHFAGVCPICGGNLVASPARPLRPLAEFPGATKRTTKPHA